MFSVCNTFMILCYSLAVIDTGVAEYVAKQLKDRDCSAYRCTVPVEKRLDCAPGEVSRESCLARGCCFDNSKFNTTWCFRAIKLPQGSCPHAECQVMPERRQVCPLLEGRKIITPSQCLSAGCCYDEDAYGAPICFKRKVYPIAFPGMHVLNSHWLMRGCNRVNPKLRTNCAKTTKCSREQCLRWRCCWLPIVLEGPQCFNPFS